MFVVSVGVVFDAVVHSYSTHIQNVHGSILLFLDGKLFSLRVKLLRTSR